MKSDRPPKHIAVIMDGNGRWAKRRLLPRNFGHKKGVETIDRMADAIFARGVEYLTLFAFSTENWNRPQEEVDGLFDLFRKYIEKNLPGMTKKGIRLNVLGNTEAFDADIRRLIENAQRQTANLHCGTLNICFNYGGRSDIVEAANRLIAAGKPVTEAEFSEALSTAGMPDPDLVIRTGGEHRISNFLLYQAAYAEIYFSDTLWPDFSEKELDAILADFKNTDRRFGKIKS